jgi:hypothetical protein
MAPNLNRVSDAQKVRGADDVHNMNQRSAFPACLQRRLQTRRSWRLFSIVKLGRRRTYSLDCDGISSHLLVREEEVSCAICSRLVHFLIFATATQR